MSRFKRFYNDKDQVVKSGPEIKFKDILQFKDYALSGKYQCTESCSDVIQSGWYEDDKKSGVWEIWNEFARKYDYTNFVDGDPVSE